MSQAGAAKGAVVEVPGIGPVTGDVAWGGNWFFLVEKHGQELSLANVEQLTDYAWRVRQAVNAQGFPEVDHVELFGPPTAAGATFQQFCAMSRAKPTTVRRAAPAPAPSSRASPPTGNLAEGEPWVQESIIGSTFTGRFRWLDRAAGKVMPVITGTAYVNSETTLLLDENDPFCWGIRS